MAPVLVSYLKIQTALASDSMAGVPEAAHTIAAASAKVDLQGMPEKSVPHYEEMLAAIAKASEALAAATHLEEARARFKDLSRPMVMWGTMSKPAGVNVMYCPMAKAKWLQDEGPVRNPYYGKSMLGCGEVVHGEEHPKP
jgi:Cu(I)/Ag(I) efflux system membrane fusion protein